MVYIRRGDLRRRVADSGKKRVDLFAETGLLRGVLAEEVDGPGEGGGGCFVAGGEERHELVDELVVGEAAGFDGDAEDVGVGAVAFFELGALGADELAGDALDGADGFFEFFVAFDGEVADEPFGEEE